MTQVSLENLTKVYGGNFLALDSLNLEIKSGEFVSILGPSGCGKTTTLKLIAGLLDPTDGRIYFDDEDVTYTPPQNRGIGLVFQDYAVFPHMTGYENIAYGLRIRKIDKSTIRQRVLEVAQLLELEETLNKKPREMNVGELQRISLARALVIDPRVLLLDEPLSNLDAALRIKARLELTRLRSALKKTIIYVTHDQFEAMTLSDRIAVLKSGVLQQYDDPRTLFEKPRNKFVAGFIGSPPMNFIEASLRQRDGGYIVDGGEFSLSLPSAHIEPLGISSAEIVLGVRPQHVYVRREPGPERIKSRVYAIEDTGVRKVVTLSVAETLFKAITERYMDIKMDEEVWLELDKKSLHIFDRRSEERLVSG